MYLHSETPPPRRNGVLPAAPDPRPAPVIAMRERSVCGTLIEGHADLPANLSTLVRFAPQVFQSPDLGQIVAAVRRLREAGKPVHPVALSDALGEGGSFLLLATLPEEALPLAGYMAIELFESGFAGYCWKRLLTISAEDCAGILTQEIKALHESFVLLNQGAKQPRSRIFLSKAVILLCQARKSRDADHL